MEKYEMQGLGYSQQYSASCITPVPANCNIEKHGKNYAEYYAPGLAASSGILSNYMDSYRKP